MDEIELVGLVLNCLHGLNKIGTCHCHQVITDGAASDISRTSEIQMH